MNNAQSTSQKVVAWARPVYAKPVNAPDTGGWDELVDIEFHTCPEKPEGEGWYPLVVADTGRQSTHSDNCWSWGPRHYECALREIERLRAEVAEWKVRAALVRNAVLEEAVWVCIETGSTKGSCDAAFDMADACAEAIRALKEQS